VFLVGEKVWMAQDRDVQELANDPSQGAFVAQLQRQCGDLLMEMNS
jgi:hypothetical protein